MEREDIEKAAKDYSIGKTHFRRSVLKEVDADDYVLRKDNCREDFITGAEWRINSVWHDAANGKAENKPALIEYTHRDGSCGYLVVPNPQEVKEAIDRWAYIEDLLPVDTN